MEASIGPFTSGIIESHSVVVVWRVRIQTGRPSYRGEVGDLRVGDVSMVVTEDTNSSSSPSDCILRSLVVIRTPVCVCVCVGGGEGKIDLNVIYNCWMRRYSSPLLVSSTFSALLGSPNHAGVWLSGRFSTHCRNCSRLCAVTYVRKSSTHTTTDPSISRMKMGMRVAGTFTCIHSAHNA